MIVPQQNRYYLTKPWIVIYSKLFGALYYHEFNKI